MDEEPAREPMLGFSDQGVLGPIAGLLKAPRSVHHQPIVSGSDVVLDETHRALAASIEDVANHPALAHIARILPGDEAGHAVGDVLGSKRHTPISGSSIKALALENEIDLFPR